MKPIKPVLHLCLALSLAACGGGDLSIGFPGERASETLELEFSPGRAAEHRLPFRISGGLPPYVSSIDGCPDWVTLFPDQGILAGTAPGGDQGKTFLCTYEVEDSSISFPQSTSFLLRLAVGSPALLVLPPPMDQMFSIGTYHSVPFPVASGGVAPYTYAFTCAGGMLPSGMGFAPATHVFAGTPEARFRDSCTYTVTDSSQPEASVSRGFELIIDPLDRGTWRFRTRSRERSEYLLFRSQYLESDAPLNVPLPFAVLPHAIGGEQDPDLYELLDLRSPLGFEATDRQLTYAWPGVNPLVGTPTTFRYQVFVVDDALKRVHDALCVDIGYSSEVEEDGTYRLFATVWIRDDVFWNGTEYRCPDAPPSSTSLSRSAVSNPVHSALAPVHARHAVDVAHAAVRDHVRGWSPGEPRARSAISPAVGFASLSGLSEGFDYSGSSESLSVGAEMGAGLWQAGLVASFARTDLRYQAESGLSGRGYDTGEHVTELFSVHPFAAWHAPTGGRLWASLGAGLGDLRHRDDLGFPSWSRSDVRLRSYAAGVSVPLADVLSGELGAEAGIESFAFEIEGGDRISTSLPTLRGRDYRAGLTWSAPVPGAPSLSLAYERLTGDGPEGARVEVQGAVSVADILYPRLTLSGSVEASLGLGDYEQDSWQFGGGVRFAPDGIGRGLGLNLDTRIMKLADRRSDGVGVRGEASYSFWGGSFLGTLRPYLGLIRYPGDVSVRQSVGLNLRNTPTSKVSVEVRDHPGNPSRAIELTFRHRF